MGGRTNSGDACKTGKCRNLFHIVKTGLVGKGSLEGCISFFKESGGALFGVGTGKAGGE